MATRTSAAVLVVDDERVESSLERDVHDIPFSRWS
jgi:hypothetical protein